MSFFVTCLSLDGTISAFSQLNLVSKFEVALVEYFISDPIKIYKGIVQIFKNSNLSNTISISNWDTLDDFNESEFPIKYERKKSQLVLTAGDDHVFKIDWAAKQTLKIESNYKKSIIIREKDLFKPKQYFIFSDIIVEHSIGDMKKPILRSIVISSKHEPHRIFSDPHYVEVNKTTIHHINICVKDENFNDIQIPKNSTFKLHFRLKK